MFPLGIVPYIIGGIVIGLGVGLIYVFTGLHATQSSFFSTTTTSVQVWRLVVGGLLVGFGTRLSRGCTSGHGISGLASLSTTSAYAVATFLAVGIATALLIQALGVTP
jgi:uncharacterized membrane protein YedE/YeeE